jgi:hypothetical protein
MISELFRATQSAFRPRERLRNHRRSTSRSAGPLKRSTAAHFEKRPAKREVTRNRCPTKSTVECTLKQQRLRRRHGEGAEIARPPSLARSEARQLASTPSPARDVFSAFVLTMLLNPTAEGERASLAMWARSAACHPMKRQTFLN